MGQPISHGYPDWGRQQSPSDVILANQIARVLTADTVVYSGFVGNAPYVQAFVTGSTVNRTRVVFTWFADAALAIEVGRTSITMDIFGRFDLSIPINGPYVSILFQASAYNSTVTYAFIIGVVSRSRVTHDTAAPVLITLVGVAVGIGATVTGDASNVRPGPAILSVDTALATWTARLQFGSLAGVFTTMASFRNTSLPGPRLVALHGAWSRISFTNTTAAAGTVDMCLVAIVQGFG